MLERWLTFGLSPEQEDRFRQACLDRDIHQARICILLILAALIAFSLNDYSFLGLSWRFYALSVLRLALLIHTFILLRVLPGFTNYRLYDKTVLLWGFFFAVFIIVVAATRPGAFVAHTIVAALAVFVAVLAIPIRFSNQLIVSLAITFGETLVLIHNLLKLGQGSLTVFLSLFGASFIAIPVGWQLHFWRRREFLAREEEHEAGAEAERRLAEKLRAEDALHRANAEWEQTFHSVPDLIAILNDRHRIVRVNQAMAQRLGHTPEECIGLPCFKAVHGLEAPPEFCPHSLTISDGCPHTAEVHEPNLGGDFLVTTVPLPGAGLNGEVVHVARDITERKQVERDYRMSAAFLATVNSTRNVRELVKAAVTFLRLYSGCSAVGIRFKKGDDFPYYEASGIPEEFLLAENKLCTRDKTGAIARDPDGEPILECMCGNVIRGQFDPSRPFFSAQGSFWTNSTTEFLAEKNEANRQFMTRDRCNGQGYESVLLLPLKIGNLKLGLLQLSDCTKGMFSPASIALWERLSGYLAVALAKEMAEEELRQTAAELKRSNQDLEQFAYVASHDLQEPLRIVSGFLTLLQNRYGGQLDAMAREYIAHSSEGAQRMSQLIYDMLEYSQVKNKTLEPTDAGDSLVKALDNLRGAIQASQAAVTYDELPMVMGDPVQLVQLFQNLIDNAIKFRVPGRPCQVHVGIQKEQARCVFHIRDNGIGIPADQHDRIFQIFQRLHSHTKYPGTGIGLAICKRIVERHGGSIWVESTPGEGSTFSFSLSPASPG